jgi:hypothetical protein
MATIEKWKLYDFKHYYPSTTDFVDELIEWGWNNPTKLTKENQDNIASCLLRDNDEVIYNIPDLNKLLADQIKAPLSVHSNNNLMVYSIITANKELIRRLFDLVIEDHSKSLIKYQAEEYNYKTIV